ncbi:MAG: hypothetical protein RR234_00580 [Christensenella sp.]
MKKLLVLILALAMAMSLVACGNSSKPAPSAPTSTSAPTADLENAEFTPKQQAAAQKFIDIATRYDAEPVNVDTDLAEIQEVVQLMNDVADAIIEADAIFADTANMTAEVLADIDLSVVQAGLLLDEVEAMLANCGGKETVTIPVEIANETDVEYIYLISIAHL